jgi:hypothetical protein
MENYRVHPFMQNKNGYEMILETVPFGTVSRMQHSGFVGLSRQCKRHHIHLAMQGCVPYTCMGSLVGAVNICKLVLDRTKLDQKMLTHCVCITLHISHDARAPEAGNVAGGMRNIRPP